MVNAACGIFIAIAVIALTVAALLAIAWAFTFTSSITPMMIPLMGLFTPVLLALITAGLIMSLYIPLVPFIIFTFGAIGWFINVIEAMIAAPLVALGIAHPEGQEILGKAEPAVILLVNIFLRPTFMIFGLLIGMMLSYVGIWLLNAGFGTAWTSVTGNVTGFTSLLSLVGIMLIYALVVLQIVQKSFSLIHVIPDEVLKWIGGNIKGMGGEAEAEKAIAGGAQSGAETVGKVGQAAGAVGDGAMKSGAETAKTKKANAASDPVELTSTTPSPGAGGTATQSDTGTQVGGSGSGGGTGATTGSKGMGSSIGSHRGTSGGDGADKGNGGGSGGWTKGISPGKGGNSGGSSGGSGGSGSGGG